MFPTSLHARAQRQALTNFRCEQGLASDKYFSLSLQEIESGKLLLIEGDITRVDLRQLFGSDPQTKASQKVVANLPFNITTDVLKLLLPLGDVISEVFVMLQVRLTNALLQLPCTASL